ncbi:MAG TPA: sugar phosphate isomerase/epimerase [Longimicrobiaceae bacterium]
MRLGYNTNGFAHHRLDDALEILAAIGYQAVALTPDVHHLPPFSSTTADMRRLRRRLEELNLAPVVEAGARFVLDPRRKHRPTLLEADPGERRQRFEMLGRCLEIAAEIGAPQLSIWSGGLPAGVTEEEGWGRLVPAVHELCERAATLGVGVAFEPEPGMFVESMEGWERLRDAVSHPALGLTLDVGHVRCTEDYGPGEAIRRYADDLRNVHLDDMRGRIHDHLQIGEGELDFRAILEALREVNYQGVASVELSRHSHAAPAAAQVAFERLQAAASAAG